MPFWQFADRLIVDGHLFFLIFSCNFGKWKQGNDILFQTFGYSPSSVKTCPWIRNWSKTRKNTMVLLYFENNIDSWENLQNKYLFIFHIFLSDCVVLLDNFVDATKIKIQDYIIMQIKVAVHFILFTITWHNLCF